MKRSIQQTQLRARRHSHHSARLTQCSPFRVEFCELLEPRRLLTTFTVTNLADSGPGSLRDAIIQANVAPGPDAINFDPSVAGTIALTSGQLLVTDSVMVNGPGADRVAVSGSDLSRVFRVAGPGVASSAIAVGLSGLTISNGRATLGGGIVNFGFSDLTLDRVVLRDNHANSSSGFTGGGGAYSVGSGSSLSVKNSLITGNTAESATVSAYGGGLFAFLGSHLTVLNSAVISNQAISGNESRGGGIQVLQATGDIRNSWIRDNQSLSAAGSAYGGGAGAYFGELSLQNTLVTGNRAQARDDTFGRGRFGVGGGVDFDTSDGSITRCLVNSNQAIGGTGIDVPGIGDGGGIRVKLGTVSIAQCVITENKAVGSADGGNGQGGGILGVVSSDLTITDTLLAGNEAIATDGSVLNAGQGEGGGIALFYSSHASISNSTFTNNRAVGGSHASNAGSDLDIGIATGGAISVLLGSSIEVNNSTFSGNSAIGGSNCTSIAPNAGDTGSAHGGAIYVDVGASALIKNSTVTRNRAIGGSGNIGTTSTGFIGSGVGGGLESTVDGTLFGYGANQLIVINSTVAGNEAVGGNNNAGTGDMIFVGAGVGGGIANSFGATTDVQGSAIQDNTARGGRGNAATGAVARVNLGAGGGVFNSLSNVKIDADTLPASIMSLTNTQVQRNVALGGSASGATAAGDGWGGGALNDAACTLNVRGGIITRNLAMGGDGGDNQSDGQGIGGGVYNLGVFAKSSTTVIRKNHASTSNDDVFGPVVPLV